MQLSPEQQKILEEQKKNCIFCQIIEGKIPSKKIYEDKLVVGILDINPASNGHVLLMPKEHYPIMPLIPTETFKHLFDKTKAIDRCVKNSLLCKETTIFIANGGAAGQQSAHFMLHIIPRDKGDELEMMDVKGKEVPEDEIKEVIEKAGGILNAMLQKNLPALGFTEGKASGVPEGGTGPAQKVTKEQLLQIIDSNPQVKQLILNQTDQFKQLVPQHAQLKQLFSQFNLDEIIEEVKRRSKPKTPGKLSLEGDALRDDAKKASGAGSQGSRRGD
ncbi:MAG: HIT domain-containing protein [Candidatus Woesearchaeota archaeon]